MPPRIRICPLYKRWTRVSPPVLRLFVLIVYLRKRSAIKPRGTDIDFEDRKILLVYYILISRRPTRATHRHHPEVLQRKNTTRSQVLRTVRGTQQLVRAQGIRTLSSVDAWRQDYDTWCRVRSQVVFVFKEEERCID